jgi:putative PIN family toxin of toxin-antitoxin system
MRATLDTNVYISALNFSGVPAQILDLNTDEAFVLCLSPAIVEETKRILADRFNWRLDALSAVLQPIVSRAVMVQPKRRVAACTDPDDNRILECAVESQSDFVVTGDDHLLRLGAFEGIRIVKSREFLEVLLLL